MATETYIGLPSGAWFNPDNWSGGFVPANGDTAVINGPGPVANGDVEGVTLDVSGPNPDDNNGIVEPTFTGDLDSSDTVVIGGDDPALYLGDQAGVLTLGAFQAATILTGATMINGTIDVERGALLGFEGRQSSEYPAATTAAINGSIVIAGGTVDYGDYYNTTITGTGQITLLDGGTFATDSLTSSIAFTFGDASGSVLDLGGDSFITATIAGFGGQNDIHFDGVAVTANATMSFADDILTITENGFGVATLTFVGTYSSNNFVLTGGYPEQSYDITYNPCFAAGTRIAVRIGNVEVEHLHVGDTVLTASGELRAIVWTGRRAVDLRAHPDPALARPVVIRRGAFAPGIPARDLRVSPDHNIAFDDVLIPAKCLVNGLNVVVDFEALFVTYHHIELATHDLVLAEGLAAETYLDVGNRDALSPGADNPADFFSTVDLNWWRWEALGCRRLVLDGPELARARVLLGERVSVVAGAQQPNG